jgi:DNA repair protein RadC
MKNINMVAEVELVYRNKKKASERPVVNSAREAYRLLLKSWNKGKIESQEEFKIILLDTNNGCMGISNVASGTLASCEVDIKLIFVTALKARAANIILAHNHPSGCLEPSAEDRMFTNRCKDAGRLLSIMVVDHLIITKEDCFSFVDKSIF